MFLGYIFIGALVVVVVINLIRFGANIIKDFKYAVVKVHRNKWHNMTNKLRTKVLILGFCIASIIINPIKVISLNTLSIL